MRKLLLGLVLPLVASVVYAEEALQSPAATTTEAAPTQTQQQETLLRADHPEAYNVVMGDTLWGISNRFLKQPWLWPEIWHANPQIKNPHLIYPGDTVKLVYIDGKPMLTVERAPAGGTVKLSPGGIVKLSPSIRESSLDTAIPAISLEAIGPFLTENRIVDDKEIKKAPHVIAGGSQHVALGAGDSIFARGEFVGDIPAYGVYRESEAYVDPITQEILGTEMRGIGNAKVLSKAEDVEKLELVTTREEILVGDKLLATEENKVESSFFPSPPDQPIDGHILSVLSGVSQVGQFSAVAISKGSREGLKPGNILAIYQKGEVVQDRDTAEQIRLPSEKAGLLMVFRVFEKVSYGLVLSAERPLAVLDEVKNPN